MRPADNGKPRRLWDLRGDNQKAFKDTTKPNGSHRIIQPPKAIAKKFGCVHAVYVRDLGVISRVGLYGDAAAAIAAAKMLNEVFAEGAT